MKHTTQTHAVLLTAIGAWLNTFDASAQDMAPPIEPPPPVEAPFPIQPAAPVEPPPPVDIPPAVEAQTPVETAPEAEPASEGPKLKAAVGVGLRAELQMDPDRPEPEDSPVYSVAHNLRPYFSGEAFDFIKFEGNLDVVGSNIQLLDAVLKLEFNEYFNLWLGRFLPPSDRANLSGPYFQNAWTYPGGVNAYPSTYAGRDEGLAVWGHLFQGHFKWQAGAFGMEGGTAEPRLAGRIVVNVLDPEPGYYNSSTYYGSKDVLAIGGAIQHSFAPEGAADEAADTNWNLDALYEGNFSGAGTLDIEGAFYGFGGSDAGNSFFALASFMFEPILGVGRLQPMFRAQLASWDDGESFSVFGTDYTPPPNGDASLLTLDFGLNYIIDGHNARLSATLTHTRFDADVEGFDGQTDTIFILGGQVQAF